MVAYILSLADKQDDRAVASRRRARTSPPAGSGDAPKGVVVLRAAYTDRGANGMPAITKEKTVVLRSPTVVVASGELSEGVSKQSVPELPVEITVVSRPGATVAFKQLDLTGVDGGDVSWRWRRRSTRRRAARSRCTSIRRLAPLLGESEMIRPTTDAAAPPARLRTTLRPTPGVHDVYLVFRKPDAKGDGFLFGLLTATFEAARR